MIGRIVWFAVLLAIAVVTAALQIDKQSASTPALAPLVPAPLRNFAQAQIAAQAVQGDDPARALAEARTLVSRRPLPAEYLTLLAVAQTKAGEAEKGGITIQIAGQRGWREPIAQEAVLRLALAAGDKAEAARRYTALLLRQKTPDALLLELGSAALDEPGGAGQQTMTALIVGAERWHNMFLRRGADVMPPAAFSAITLASQDAGARFNCDKLYQAIEIVARRDAAVGQQMQRASDDCAPTL